MTSRPVGVSSVVWPRDWRVLARDLGVVGSVLARRRERAISPRVALAMWLTTERLGTPATMRSWITRTAATLVRGFQAAAYGVERMSTIRRSAARGARASVRAGRQKAAIGPRGGSLTPMARR